MNKKEFLINYRNKYPHHYSRLILKNNKDYFNTAKEYCEKLNLNLNSNSKILYHYAFSLKEIPKCITCGKPINAFSANRNFGYNRFCGKSCAASNPDIIKLRVNNRTLSTTEVLKQKKTQIKNSECEISEHQFIKFIKDLEIFSTNIEKTLISKYPKYYKFYLDNWEIPILEVIYLIKNDLKKPYCEFCSQPIRFETYYKGYVKGCGNRLCYAKKTGKTKRKIGFPIWIDRLKAKNIEVTSTQKEYIENGNINLNCKTCNYKWNRKVHTTIHAGCPRCKIRHSYAEKEISNYLNNLEIQTIENDKKTIYPKELDICILDKKIAIEYNGNYWHTEGNGKDKKYHLNKTEECENKDIQLIHIFENEWIYKKDIIKSLLNSKLKITDRIYARKCKIKEIDSKAKNLFLTKTHLQGKDKASVKLGLFYNEKLVAVMTFCKSRFNNKYEWELSRFSSDLNTTVVGGAGKLFEYFKKIYSPVSVITYSNRRYSNGNLYKQLGFDFLYNSSPNYFYVIGNCLEFNSRHQFQKHKLKDKLEYFDSNLSEWDNMQLNGYDRIWDCGNGVWSWTQ